MMSGPMKGGAIKGGFITHTHTDTAGVFIASKAMPSSLLNL